MVGVRRLLTKLSAPTICRRCLNSSRSFSLWKIERDSPVSVLCHVQQSSNKSTYPPMQDVEAVEEALDGVEEESISLTMADRYLDDEERSHLRTKLYPVESDPTGVLEKLYQVGSVQEVFDIIKDADEVNVKFSSQALVTLWDLQKLLFQIGPIFNPREDIINKTNFVQGVKDNDIFREKILRPVVENHKDLEDEPLCATLLAMKKMNYKLTEFEPLIEECFRRKENLSLTGLSRLSVCLRSQSLYGLCILAEFSPLILHYCKTMTEDMDIRLVSIILRNGFKIISDEIIKVYITRINEILDSQVKFETVTYCKMFLVLLDWARPHLSQQLIHRIGNILAERAPKMDIMEILSLQKFLLSHNGEPYSLVKALLSRNLRVMEEEKERPRIDLLTAVGPYMKKTEQKKKLALLAHECLNLNDFNIIQNVLFPLIRSLRINDRNLHDKYWNNVLKSVENGEGDFRKVVFCSKNYLNFSHSLMFDYRHSWLERVLKRRIYSFLDNYISDKPKLCITPADFSVIFSFLVAFDQHYLDLRYLQKFSDFAPQMKPNELCFIAKGVDAALFGSYNNRKPYPRKNYEIINQVCSILEEECAIRLLSSDGSSKVANNNSDLTMIYRIISIIRKMKGDSPLLDVGVKAFLGMENHDSREIRELCNLLLGGNYLYPEALKVVSDYFLKNLQSSNPEAVERFMNLTYVVGWDKNDDTDFGKLGEIINKHWEQLGLGIIQCGIALGFHRQLKPELINKIFTVDFLDFIDQELLNTFGRSYQYPVKLRQQLCELNRIVCLDVPSAGLPWFHEKFMQKQVSQGRPKPTYLLNEVSEVLTDLIGAGAVESNVCLSKNYYYSIDFVLKFDRTGRIIKSKPKSAFSFYRNSKVDESDADVKRKVAIMVLNDYAFTKNVRNLKGGFKMKQRHLEMLGYDVVIIDSHLWNSMYMSELTLKQQFLESKIFASN